MFCPLSTFCCVCLGQEVNKLVGRRSGNIDMNQSTFNLSLLLALQSFCQCLNHLTSENQTSETNDFVEYSWKQQCQLCIQSLVEKSGTQSMLDPYQILYYYLWNCYIQKLFCIKSPFSLRQLWQLCFQSWAWQMQMLPFLSFLDSMFCFSN